MAIVTLVIILVGRITFAPRNCDKRRIMKAIYSNLKRPCLNEQFKTKTLTLFRNGVT